ALNGLAAPEDVRCWMWQKMHSDGSAVPLYCAPVFPPDAVKSCTLPWIPPPFAEFAAHAGALMTAMEARTAIARSFAEVVIERVPPSRGFCRYVAGRPSLVWPLTSVGRCSTASSGLVFTRSYTFTRTLT